MGLMLFLFILFIAALLSGWFLIAVVCPFVYSLIGGA